MNRHSPTTTISLKVLITLSLYCNQAQTWEQVSLNSCLPSSKSHPIVMNLCIPKTRGVNGSYQLKF
jgi:hypothetical protein